MNSHKKDVNDYFKYLRLYYMELAKKRKKELEEKKKKEELIAQRRKKQQEEFDIAKKQLQDNIDNINKKKVVSKSDINKNEIKENTKVNNLEYVINPNIKNSVKDTKENEKKKNNTNLKQEQIKKQEEQKQKLEVEKTEVQKKQEIEKKNAEVQKKLEAEKKKVEIQKKQEVEKKNADEQKKLETEKKEKETKNKTPKGIDSKTNEKNKDKLETKDKNTKKSKKNKEEPNNEKKENKKENKKEEPKNNKEKQEDDKKKKTPKEEEKIKLGKNEFIKTINKRIKDDYESLRELDLEVHRINSLLNNTKDISDIKKLMDRLNNNQKNISSIIDRINMIKDSSIISVAYSLSKTKPNELKDYIKLLEKEPNNSKYLKELYPEFKAKLDYTDTINNIKKKTDKQSETLNKKHNELIKLENKKENNDVDLSNFNTKINTFKDKLLHFQMSIMSLENKVRGIKPIEKTETKYFLNNIEIKNTHQLEQIAIKLSKDPNNKMPAEQIFNNLRSKLKTVTNNTIVPSNNLKNSLLEEKNKLNLTNKDIISTLKEIKEFKNEFELEFNDQLSTSEFYEYYSEIEAVENKLTNQKNKADLLNSTIDKSIIENDKKIAEIEKMNLEKEKQQKLKDKEKQNEQKQQTNKPKEQTNNKNNYYNMYQDYYNQMYGYNNMEQEEERKRSR